MVRECSPSQEETHASRSISGCLLRAGGLQLQSVVYTSLTFGPVLPRQPSLIGKESDPEKWWTLRHWTTRESESLVSCETRYIVVANDIRHDFSALQIHLGRHILPANVRDTSTCVALRKIAGVPAHASLHAFARGVLGRRVQVTRPHSPVEDTAVAMELYRAVEEECQ